MQLVSIGKTFLVICAKKIILTRIEIPNQQEDLNLVKNLPEVITPVRAKSKIEPSKADEKKVNFFGPPNRGKKIYIKANKSEYPSFIPNKLILDSKPKPPVFLKPLNPSAIFQHKQVFL